MNFALGSAAENCGCRLAAFGELASTNDEALRLARAGENGPLWLVAERQTGGHGRRGRPWSSPDGNLAATYLAALDVPADEIASLGFVAAVALHGAIGLAAPELATRVSLKWPNDVLGDGCKLAGILIEVTQGLQERHAVAVGFGVNVAATPSDLPYAATSLRELGAKITAECLFAALTDSWAGALALWSREGGMAAIRSAWLGRASGLGQPIQVATPAELLEGTFSTIDERGRLVIETSGGARTVTAGEVFFGTAATRRAG